MYVMCIYRESRNDFRTRFAFVYFVRVEGRRRSLVLFRRLYEVLHCVDDNNMEKNV